MFRNTTNGNYFEGKSQSKLVSIKLGEVMEKCPPKFTVIFEYTDGVKEEIILDESELKDVKEKFSAYIKNSKSDSELFKPSAVNINNQTTQAPIIQEYDFELDESDLVLSPTWRGKR